MKRLSYGEQDDARRGFFEVQEPYIGEIIPKDSFTFTLFSYHYSGGSILIK